MNERAKIETVSGYLKKKKKTTWKYILFKQQNGNRDTIASKYVKNFTGKKILLSLAFSHSTHLHSVLH